VPVGLWRRTFPKTTIGLCYHVVSDKKLPHLKHYSPLSTVQFEADLSYMTTEFNVIGYEELIRRRSATNIVGDNSVVFTFDDGFAECATAVRPILLRYGANCIFFIITDLIDNCVMFRESQASLCIDAILQRTFEQVQAIIGELGLEARLSKADFRASGFPLGLADLGCIPDPRLQSLINWLLTITFAETDILDRLCELLDIDTAAYLQRGRPYLSTEQIRNLVSDGFTIGAHSRSHRRLQDLSLADAEQEIVESCRIVRDLTGQKSVPFAFPYSGRGMDRKWLAQLRQKYDFIGLFFDTGGLRRDAPFVVQRIFGERITGAGSMDSILRGAWARRAAWNRGG
jgi:peptidoglycan/xylan/chitin deacetylase (PgdA/CDA1 family)